MNLLQRSLIEKAGHDHGFEHVVASEPAGVLLASARHATTAQVVVQPAGGYLLRLRAETPALLPEMRRSFPQQRQTDGFSADTVASLATLLRRAAGLARALPSQAANDFEATVAAQLAQLPANLGGTEVERLVRQRVGQQKFREAMLDYWGGACAVTAVHCPKCFAPAMQNHGQSAPAMRSDWTCLTASCWWPIWMRCLIGFSSALTMTVNF